MYFLLLLFFMTGRENLTDQHTYSTLWLPHIKNAFVIGKKNIRKNMFFLICSSIWIIVIHVMNLHISTDKKKTNFITDPNIILNGCFIDWLVGWLIDWLKLKCDAMVFIIKYTINKLDLNLWCPNCHCNISAICSTCRSRADLAGKSVSSSC